MEQCGKGEGGKGTTEGISLCMTLMLQELGESGCMGGKIPTGIGRIVEDAIVGNERM